jgi:hypothetical protein
MTKLKTISVLLAIGLMWVGGYLLAHAGEAPAIQSNSTEVSPVASDSVAAVPHKVIAYYFHGNVRCATCRRIEAFTRESIDSVFATDLKKGTLEFRAVNIDSAVNKHYIGDYQLYTRSVILSDLHKGTQARWKNLDKVWMLSGNKGEFTKYIQSEVTAYLDTTQ